VSKKRREGRADPFEFKRVHILAGIAVVALSAAAAIGVITLLGGDEISKPDVVAQAPEPAGPPPALPRSEAAEILASTTWDDMSAGDRELLQAEVTRVFGDARFRTQPAGALASDVFRVDGETRAWRVYQPSDTPGGAPGVAETLTFYCGPAGGALTEHRYLISAVHTATYAEEASFRERPWQPVLSALDWSSARDRGWAEVAGRRVHGFEMRYAPTPGGIESTVSVWFDVEDARLLERRFLNPDGVEEAVVLDWRQPAPIVLPEGQPAPECVERIRETLDTAPG
jgi:hypothetical protein